MRSADADQNMLSDEDLCRQAALGDRLAEEILAVRYHRLVRICARPYFLAGGDSEDLIQEGMMPAERHPGVCSRKGKQFPHLRRDLHPKSDPLRHPGGCQR